MEQVVMSHAEDEEVVKVGGPAVGPVDDVVSVGARPVVSRVVVATVASQATRRAV